MSKKAIIEAIQAVVDASGDNDFRISLGAPGGHLKNVIGETRPTGSAWSPEPTSFSLIMEGLAKFMGTAREVNSSGGLMDNDHRIELIDNNVTITLPAASEEYIGEYVIKSMGVTGGAVSGDIDGAPASLPVVGWEFLAIYCNGSAWLTG